MTREKYNESRREYNRKRYAAYKTVSGIPSLRTAEAKRFRRAGFEADSRPKRLGVLANWGSGQGLMNGRPMYYV
jgi:hypothetical protein